MIETQQILFDKYDRVSYFNRMKVTALIPDTIIDSKEIFKWQEYYRLTFDRTRRLDCVTEVEEIELTCIRDSS